MKRVIVIFLAVFALTVSARAQRWTASGGVLGALNFSKFRVSGTNTLGLDYSGSTGGAGGIWVNFPLGRVVSIEPQVLYSTYSYAVQTTTAPIFSERGPIGYVSVPLLFKFQIAPFLAITAGPQVDFTTGVGNFGLVNAQKSDFTSTSYSLSGGLELFPHGFITVFGRYISGLTNMNAISGSDTKLYNENIQAGIKIRLAGHKIEPAPIVAAAPVDTDGDGIADAIDKCPTIPGFARYNGCPIPDTDGDGINDELDKCPTVPGVAKYNGCPVPDTDGDGINDELDKCPTVPGVAKYNGCPIPDTDGDGINDEEDKCPNTAGIVSNYGCPEMIFHYLRNDANLGEADKADLDKVVGFMNRNPNLHIIIEGYTSSTGTAAFNQKLSQKRADNSLKYLVSKGIDASRIKAIGYGLTNPVGDNATKEGRAANRRTVMKIDKQ